MGTLNVPVNSNVQARFSEPMDAKLVRIASPRIETKHTHGTGCTYSAAIAANLAKGQTLEDAVRSAKHWLTQALATAPGLGNGIGPVNHFATSPRGFGRGAG